MDSEETVEVTIRVRVQDLPRLSTAMLAFSQQVKSGNGKGQSQVVEWETLTEPDAVQRAVELLVALSPHQKQVEMLALLANGPDEPVSGDYLVEMPFVLQWASSKNAVGGAYGRIKEASAKLGMVCPILSLDGSYLMKSPVKAIFVQALGEGSDIASVDVHTAREAESLPVGTVVLKRNIKYPHVSENWQHQTGYWVRVAASKPATPIGTVKDEAAFGAMVEHGRNTFMIISQPEEYGDGC